MQVSVTISGDKEFIKKLDALGPKLQNFEGAFMLLGRELSNFYGSKVFASRGGALGDRWAPLSPVYAVQKAKKFPGRGILSATGMMERSFTTKVTPSLLVIGNDAPYFKYHQSTEERHKLPRRPMMGVNSEVKAIVQTIIQADIKEKIKGL